MSRSFMYWYTFYTLYPGFYSPMVLYPGFTAHFTGLLSGKRFCLQFYCFFLLPSLLLHQNTFEYEGIISSSQISFYTNQTNEPVLWLDRGGIRGGHWPFKFYGTIQNVSVWHTGLFLNFLILQLRLKGRSCTTYFELINGANLTEISQRKGSRYLKSNNSRYPEPCKQVNVQLSQFLTESNRSWMTRFPVKKWCKF